MNKKKAVSLMIGTRKTIRLKGNRGHFENLQRFLL